MSRPLLHLPSIGAALALAGALAPAAAGVFGNASAVADAFPRNRTNEFKEGEILVRFKPSVPASQRDAKHVQEGNAKLRELRRSGVHVVRIKPSQTIAQALARYRADTIVEYAEPNHLLRPMRLPNEPSFDLLWNLQNSGQTLGTPGADIRAPAAWDTTTGSASVAVMVIDTGIDTAHADLAANVWVNPGETPGNGIDDDANGYVDDVHGIDVVNRDGDPADDHGHGTHVAGTIGAVGDNALGIAGVAWNVKLIGCKFLDAAGTGTVDQAVECLEYARALKARGVNIVATNNSYGALGVASATLREAIAAQPDILFVAAAGNFGLDNDTNDFFPANFDLPNVVSVAATDHHDALAAFSDTGRRSVHLGAPGVSITSTVPFDGYTTASGTSMAAPHVAGAAALLKAANPARDTRAIRNLLLAGGANNASLAGRSVSGRRLDAAGALNCSNRALFSVLRAPPAFTVGVPATVTALSIDCANAVGPVGAVASSGETFTLRDDGVAPDLAAGDGVFAATWTPTQPFAWIDLSSAAGSERLTMLDLTLAAVAAQPNVNRGDALAVSVTAANPSTSAAPESSVQIYFSTDGVITASDVLLGTFPVPALGGGAQQVVSGSVTVPSNVAQGAYFVGAIVDPANLLDEGNEANNARAGNVVNVGSVATDLVVASVGAPTSAFTGDPVALSATVTNTGTATAAESTLNLYPSTDSVVTTADLLFATSPIGTLAGGASQTVTGTVALPVTLPPGSYTIGAIADAANVVAETDETNNARAAGTITTTTRPIDLTITTVTNGSTAKDGAAVSLGATVRNVGTAAAPPATLRWYLSTDATITPDDTPLASITIPSLGGGSQKKYSASAAIPTSVPAGTYTVGAIVDPDYQIAETDDANNAVRGGTLSVSWTVDLALLSASGPAAAATGQSVTFNASLRNKGPVATPGNVTVGFYLSTDATITTADTRVGSTTLAPVAGNTTVPVAMTAALRTSLLAGTYWIGAIADPDRLVAEASDGNNAALGGTIVVSYGPDLLLTSAAAPSAAARGETITVNTTLFNQGTGAVGALSDPDLLGNPSPLRVGIYLSSNGTVTADDQQIGSVTIGSIAPGQAMPLAIAATIPSNLAPGRYTIGVIADFSQAVRESDELNNALAGGAIDITSR